MTYHKLTISATMQILSSFSVYKLHPQPPKYGVILKEGDNFQPPPSWLECFSILSNGWDLKYIYQLEYFWHQDKTKGLCFDHGL